MIHSKFIAGKLVEKVNVPESWADVPFSQYVDFVKLCEEGSNGSPNPKDVFKLLFGLSKEMVDSNFKIEMLESMNQQLNFLSATPKTDRLATHFKFGEKVVRIPSSISEMKLGKYRDIVETGSSILTGSMTKMSEMLTTFPEMIAVFVAPEGYTQTDLDDMKVQIEKLATPEIVELGNFFMNQFVSLKNGTSKNWFKTLIPKTGPISSQDSTKSLKILVTY